MALVAAVDLHKTYVTQDVLRGVSFEIRDGEKVGLVGINGGGKTTILRILLGQEEPDTGTVQKSRDLRIGYVPQIRTFDGGATLRQEVRSGFSSIAAIEAEMHVVAERMGNPRPDDDLDRLAGRLGRLQERFEQAGGYDADRRLEMMLHGLGFADEDFDKPMSVLSGGQRSRAALAKMLLQESDLLLLDEPTNHLDIEATAWLEDYLRDFPGAALIISHDRTLLDRTTTRTLELVNGRTTSWPGNYSEFTQLKEEKLEADKRLYKKQQAFIEKTEEFIRRFQAGQRCKEARGRKTRLNRARDAGEFIERPNESRRTMGVRLSANERSGNDIVLCDDLSAGFDGRSLFSGLSFRIDRGERVGVVGPNGVGKTTLLRILLGRVPALGGEIRFGRNVTVGYYDQQHSDLDTRNTVLDELWRVRPRAPEGEVRSMLGRFLFSGDDVTKMVGNLSGGERSRVVLAKLIWAGHNVLVLDEPTNHLDIAACEALEEALGEYDGTLLMVSHDRYFLDRIVDRLLVLHPDGHEDFLGGWTDYAEKVAERTRVAFVAREEKKRLEAEQGKRDRARAVAAAAAARKPAGPRDRFARMSLEQIEADIIAREERVAELSRLFADPDVARDAARSVELKSEYARLQTELTEYNAAWSRKAEGG
jgi:ATP-binding cassette subfamily F protein 3